MPRVYTVCIRRLTARQWAAHAAASFVGADHGRADIFVVEDEPLDPVAKSLLLPAAVVTRAESATKLIELLGLPRDGRQAGKTASAYLPPARKGGRILHCSSDPEPSINHRQHFSLATAPTERPQNLPCWFVRSGRPTRL